MKPFEKCPVCGDGFVGFEKLCPVCIRIPARSPTEQTRPLRDPSYTIGKLTPGESCPHCGMKYRPRMSNAERQRKYRERKSHGRT